MDTMTLAHDSASIPIAPHSFTNSPPNRSPEAESVGGGESSHRENVELTEPEQPGWFSQSCPLAGTPDRTK